MDSQTISLFRSLLSALWANPYVHLVLYVLGILAALGIFISLVKKILQNPARIFGAFQSTVLLVTVPRKEKDGEQKKEMKDLVAQAETLYANLGGLSPQRGWKAFFFGRFDHVSLEIVSGNDGLISFYVIVPKDRQKFVEQQIQAQYSDVLIEEVPDYNIFSPKGVILGTNLTLKKNSIFPIKTYDKAESDPLNALTNSMSKLGIYNGAAVQILIRPAGSAWYEAGRKVASEMQQGKKLKEALGIATANPFLKLLGEITDAIFKSPKSTPQGQQKDYRLSPMEEETVKFLEEKAGKAGFEVNIRVVVSAENDQTAKRNLDNIVGSFAQYGLGNGNSFQSIKPYNLKNLINNFIYRSFDEKKRFVLNTQEMTTLYHLPLSTTETPNIRWLPSVKAAPPLDMPKEGLILGKTTYRGQETLVRIKTEDRRRHLYAIGQSGTGKSFLLRNMILQDIEAGHGVCVMDPHGDLAEAVMANVPKNRIDDVIYFNPADTDRPLGLNMLEYKTDDQKDFVVGEMISIFYKLFGGEMVGPMFEHYMRNAMLALMDDKENGATIMEIPRMFTDEEFRHEKVAKVRNAVVKNFWEQEYEQSQKGSSGADMLSYVISKIGRFLTNDMMRNIMGQVKSGFNFREVMDGQKILLVNLCKGTIGEINSNLLGMIIITKLQSAAMGRTDMPEDERKDFYLYIDEFQNFITKSIEVILSEARKYRLCLNIAHQYLGQLVEEGGKTEVRDAVFGNVGTKIAFRIGVEDAEIMAKEFAPVFDENDVINVEKFTANIKLLIDNTVSRPFNMQTIYPAAGNPEIAEAVKELSRLKYGRDRTIVEAEIEERARLGELGGRTAGFPESSL